MDVGLSTCVHEQCHSVGVGAIDVACLVNPILENESVSERSSEIGSDMSTAHNSQYLYARTL